MMDNLACVVLHKRYYK